MWFGQESLNYERTIPRTNKGNAFHPKDVTKKGTYFDKLLIFFISHTPPPLCVYIIFPPHFPVKPYSHFSHSPFRAPVSYYPLSKAPLPTRPSMVPFTFLAYAVPLGFMLTSKGSELETSKREHVAASGLPRSEYCFLVPSVYLQTSQFPFFWVAE